MITRQFGIPVTSPGAILRRERDLGTPLGKKTAEVLQSGGLVSDKIIIELIEDWLRLHGGHGFVFDGFPRTLRQAESLTSILARLRTAWIWRFGSRCRNRPCAIELPADSNAANAALQPAHPVRSSQNVPSVPIATVPWYVGTTTTSVCCKLACKSSAPRLSLWHLFMEKCRYYIGSTVTAIGRQSLAISRG